MLPGKADPTVDLDVLPGALKAAPPAAEPLSAMQGELLGLLIGTPGCEHCG